MTEERETVPITNDRGQVRNYETVPSRLRRFREANPAWTINTSIIHIDDECVRVRVEIGWLNEPTGQFMLIASAHAEEYRNASEINATSALENCETSALGRALAFVGFGSADSIASAEEVIGAKAKGSAFAETKPGALILLQNAAKKGLTELESVWKKTLSAADREACRPYITKLKREASEVVPEEQKGGFGNA